MKRDFRSCMLYALFGLPIFLLLFIAILYFANCGFSADCSRASLPGVIHTPIPTLIPATLPAQIGGESVATKDKCTVTARVLLSIWVNAGYHETDPFQFTDIRGNACQATFTDVKPLFTEGNLWYGGALACSQCHNSNFTAASANLDLSSYKGILAGGKRSSPDSQGQDILGGGNWDSSLLNKMLFIDKLMPFGRPLGAVAEDGPTIQAGTLVSATMTAPTPATPEGEVARPSNPGGPGDAINLTGDPTNGEKLFVGNCSFCHGDAGTGNVPNPGSDDGTVPPLNPIDATMVSSDYQTFAYNIDLFIQNGSTPAGPNPTYKMPDWGSQGALTQQDIADVIAYIISLNK